MPNKKYYEANKEKLKEQAKIRYFNQSIEEKEKSKEYYRNWYSYGYLNLIYICFQTMTPNYYTKRLYLHGNRDRFEKMISLRKKQLSQKVLIHLISILFSFTLLTLS